MSLDYERILRDRLPSLLAKPWCLTCGLREFTADEWRALATVALEVGEHEARVKNLADMLMVAAHQGMTCRSLEDRPVSKGRHTAMEG